MFSKVISRASVDTATATSTEADALRLLRVAVRRGYRVEATRTSGAIVERDMHNGRSIVPTTRTVKAEPVTPVGTLSPHGARAPEGHRGACGVQDRRRGRATRPYGSPCQHEHAGIRCPMLQVNPKMLPRLAELEKDLLLRRKRAEEEQWFGEIDCIEMTLTFRRTKQVEAVRLTRRLTRRTPVALGLPRPHR